MARGTSERPFPAELPRLLEEREMSVRALARTLGISDAHISRVLSGRKRATADLARRAAEALELPTDYFPEYREAVVIERVTTDAVLREEIYARIRRRRS